MNEVVHGILQGRVCGTVWGPRLGSSRDTEVA
jgi:hypothetical protein